MCCAFDGGIALSVQAHGLIRSKFEPELSMHLSVSNSTRESICRPLLWTQTNPSPPKAIQMAVTVVPKMRSSTTGRLVVLSRWGCAAVRMASLTVHSVLLLVCMATAAYQSAASDPYVELEDWVIANGGTLKTSIGINEFGVRGLFSKVHAEAGEHIATIPNSVMINAGSLDSNILAGTMAVLRELFDPHTRFKPYIKVWPKPDEIMNVCNFDLKYLHMLEREKHVHVTQDFLEAGYNGEVNHDMEYTIAETVGNATVTLADLQYACAISSTRYVTEEKRRRLLMIPIFDMENHRRDCPHTTTALEGGDTVSIVLGMEVEPGEELCYPYTDTMRDDYAVLNYGFLPDIEDPPRLLEIDHHEFKHDADNQQLSETLFDGDEDELKAEIKRQQTTLDRLLMLDKAKAEGPKEGEDWRYDMLAELQERRRHSLEYEIDRLKKELDEFNMDEL